MKSKVNLGIGVALALALVLVVVLLVVVKPGAKSAANEWKRVEGAALLEEKRAAEQLDLQGRLLFETAFLAKKAGPDSSAVMRVVLQKISSDTTGLKATAVGSRLHFGWTNREIVFSFSQGKLKETNLSALITAPQGGL